MPYFMKWILSLLLAGVYWYLGLFILGYILSWLGFVETEIVGGNNTIVYVITWIISVFLAFKTTKTKFFFGAKSKEKN